MSALWNSLVVMPIVEALVFLNKVLSGMSVPYSYGFAIILLTIIIKLLTLPLTLKQFQSMKATQELQPRLKEIQKKYKNDKEKLTQAQMELYKEAGVNPLGGCLPMLVQFPILIGFYSAIYKAASLGHLTNAKFFWIPDLAFPPRGVGFSWVLPNSDKFIGWGPAIGYLVLPILLVVSQYVMQKMTVMPGSDQDSGQQMMSQMNLFMPILFGFFALQVPTGLDLYWVTSNILGIIQQYFTTGWGALLPEKEEPKKQAPKKKPPEEVKEGIQEEVSSAPARSGSKRKKKKKKRK